MTSNRSKSVAGFTLLELIIAMSMVAVLTMSLYSSLSTAYKAKQSADRAIMPIRAGTLAIELTKEAAEA